MKKCSKCLHEKVLAEFYKDKYKTDGRTAVCKDCSKSIAKATYNTNKKQTCQRKNEYYENNKERIKEFTKKYKEKNRSKINLAKQLSRIRQRGGGEYERYIESAAMISYDKMFADQNGLCAICFSPPDDRKRLSIDHCHKTGAIRGLLCHKCNLCLGHCGDDIAVLNAAINYLIKYQD